MAPQVRWAAAILLFALLAFPAKADNQGGVAIDFAIRHIESEVRLMSNGVDFNMSPGGWAHGSFLLDLEADRIAEQAYFSPSAGYELYTTIGRFTPYAYFSSGPTFGGGIVMEESLGQGLDSRISRRLTLRFEHEFDWDRQSRWSNRYTGLLVWTF